MAQRWFWPLTAALLLTLAAIQTLTIRRESQTWDEALEIASGYSYLKTGEYRMVLEHPPLARVIAALPLVAFLPPLYMDPDSWQQRDNLTFSHKLLYQSTVPAGTILSWGRATAILITLCLGLALALWTRAEFGPAAALFALTLFTFDPTVIAHGRYVKNDMLAALLCLLACAAWVNYLRREKWKLALLAGALFGLAVGTKFSSGFLLPVFVLLASFHLWKRHTKTIGALALVCVAGFAAIALVYAPQANLLIPTTAHMRQADPSMRLLRKVVDEQTAVGQALFWMGKNLGLRAHPFWEGLAILGKHNAYGHPSYLLGMLGNGWWYYFPVAFAVKTPMATLLILCIALATALRTRARLTLPTSAALVVIGVYAIMSMLAHINIGIRHLLPIYPFLFALLGASMASWRPRYALAACVLLIAESLAIYPNYTAFFNVAVGGPAKGPEYLLDSNIDWGQDLIKLKSWMDAHQIKQVCNLYFGTAETSYYGVNGPGIPNTQDLKGRADVDCFAAASVTPLYGLYMQPGEYDWLRQLHPIAKIGYSIYVYDLRK